LTKDYQAFVVGNVGSVEDVEKGTTVLAEIKDFLQMDVTTRRLQVKSHQGCCIIKQDRFEKWAKFLQNFLSVFI
jgi:hypothetical protein